MNSSKTVRARENVQVLFTKLNRVFYIRKKVLFHEKSSDFEGRGGNVSDSITLRLWNISFFTPVLRNAVNASRTMFFNYANYENYMIFFLLCAFVRASVRTYVRPSRNVRLCTVNKRRDLEAPILHTFAPRQGTFACQFSSKSSTSLTFIFKVKELNRIYWQVHNPLENSGL